MGYKIVYWQSFGMIACSYQAGVNVRIIGYGNTEEEARDALLRKMNVSYVHCVLVT